MIKLIENTFQKGFKDRYDKIFKQYYPAHDSTGFTERNLTCNYAEALIQALNDEPLKDENAFVWYEAPLPRLEKMKCQHIDAVVFSQKHNSVFFIEAKRLGDNPKQKCKAITNDINRLHQGNREYVFENWIIEPKSTIKQYIICIADFWEEKISKQKAIQLLSEIKIELDITNKQLSEVSEFKKTEKCINNYNIFLLAYEIRLSV